MRIVVALTGASGSILGVRLLEQLQQGGVETLLVVSSWGARVLQEETGLNPKDLRALVSRSFSPSDLAAPIASGSFPCHGMAVVPCSMKTLAGIAHGYSQTLIERAADVTLKEGRKLLLVPRETPLSAIHLGNMLELARSGATIMPFTPAFYAQPQSLDQSVDLFVQRLLVQLGCRQPEEVDGVWDPSTSE